MEWDKNLTSLNDVLAGLYPSKQESYEVVDAAGMSKTRIAFSERSIDNWHAILDEANKQGKVLDVIRVARKDFPRDSNLAKLEKTFLENLADPLPNILEGVPALDNYDTRTLLLRGIPENLQKLPRQKIKKYDLSNIVTLAKKLGRIEPSDEFALVIIAKNARKLVEGTEREEEINALLESVGAFPIAYPGNPFSPGPVVSPERFVGMGKEIREILDIIKGGGSVSLIGEPRTGKTNLLLKIKNLLSSDDKERGSCPDIVQPC